MVISCDSLNARPLWLARYDLVLSVCLLATASVIELYLGHLPFAVVVISLSVASAHWPKLAGAGGWHLRAHALDVRRFALAGRILAPLIRTAAKGQKSAAGLALRSRRLALGGGRYSVGANCQAQNDDKRRHGAID
jgi:hypothetical protein